LASEIYLEVVTPIGHSTAGAMERGKSTKKKKKPRHRKNRVRKDKEV